MNTANTGNTVNGLCQPVCHVLWNFDSTGLCVLLAGKAHCAMHRVGAKNVGLVGLVGLVGRLAQDACGPCALKIPECMAHTQPSAMSVSVRISPYSSVFPCPQYRHCAMCPASGLATPEPSGGGSLESPSGRQPTVTEADVRPARHFCRRIYKTSCRKRATSGPHRAMLYSSPRL